MATLLPIETSHELCAGRRLPLRIFTRLHGFHAGEKAAPRAEATLFKKEDIGTLASWLPVGR
jgi:hypothetical protein